MPTFSAIVLVPQKIRVTNALSAKDAEKTVRDYMARADRKTMLEQSIPDSRTLLRIEEEKDAPIAGA